MSQVTARGAELKAVDGSRFAVTGELGFDTVEALLASSRAEFANAAGPIEVDLSGVTQSDSAGLALLIEWLKIAAEESKGIRFSRAPEQLRALARISELDEFLPMAG